MTRDEIQREFEAARYGLNADPREVPEALIHAMMNTAEAAGLDREAALMLVAIEQHKALRELRKQHVDLLSRTGQPTRFQ